MLNVCFQEVLLVVMYPLAQYWLIIQCPKVRLRCSFSFDALLATVAAASTWVGLGCQHVKPSLALVVSRMALSSFKELIVVAWAIVPQTYGCNHWFVLDVCW